LAVEIPAVVDVVVIPNLTTWKPQANAGRHLGQTEPFGFAPLPELNLDQIDQLRRT
jgi:hypothetical protein